MRAHAVRYLLGAGAVSLVVLLLGRGLAGPAGDAGVTVGVAVACGLQIAIFGLVVLFPRHRFVAYGLGALARLVAVAGSAMALVPLAGLPPVPTLFALVSVLFGTTVLEPVLFAVQQRSER